MRAYALEAFDTPPAFVEVPEPVAGPGEVLVRVQATSVNPYDAMVANGMLRDRLEHRFPAVFGRDVAGVVERLGDGVETLAAGDEVFGFVKRDYIGDGTFAPRVAVDAETYVVRRPARLSALEAGALGLASVTALQSLDYLRVGEGTNLFVNGATGGVGSFAVQIARALGARVIATARSGEEEEHVHSLGVDETVDWSAGGVAAAVRRLAPDGVDALLDLVSTGEAFPALAEQVVVEGGRGATTRSDPPQVSGRELRMIHSTSDTALLDRIVALVDSGAVRVPVTHTYEFERLPEAFAKLREGVCGKIAVHVAD